MTKRFKRTLVISVVTWPVLLAPIFIRYMYPTAPAKPILLMWLMGALFGALRGYLVGSYPYGDDAQSEKIRSMRRSLMLIATWRENEQTYQREQDIEHQEFNHKTNWKFIEDIANNSLELNE